MIEYGQDVLYFDEDVHEYHLNETHLLSVTQYLKAGGYVRPYSGDGTKAYIGRQAHYATRLLDHGRLDWSRLDPKLVGFVRCWDQFKQERGFEPDLAWRERPAFHPIYRWAGTPDAPGLLQGHPCIVEIKTGVPEAWHKLQVKGGYQPIVAAHDPKYQSASSVLVYLHDDDTPATVVHVKEARLDLLFASITATVNGRSIYGNYNGAGT